VPNVPFTTGGTGAFSSVELNIRAALRELGETSPETLIGQMERRLIAAVNKTVDQVNRHPAFLDLLDEQRQFDPVSGASMTTGSPLLTLVSPPSNLNKYAPVRVSGAGYAGGDLRSFVIGFPGTGVLKLADAAITSITDATVSPLYTARIPRAVALADTVQIDDHVLIEGIKYFWFIDETSPTSQLQSQKVSARFFQSLNEWAQGLASYHSALENDARQDVYDY
jgi:hypothetical protein